MRVRQRLPGEAYDAFTTRIAADLPKHDGAARVILWGEAVPCTQ